MISSKIPCRILFVLLIFQISNFSPHLTAEGAKEEREKLSKFFECLRSEGEQAKSTVSGGEGWPSMIKPFFVFYTHRMEFQMHRRCFELCPKYCLGSNLFGDFVGLRKRSRRRSGFVLGRKMEGEALLWWEQGQVQIGNFNINISFTVFQPSLPFVLGRSSIILSHNL